MKVKRYKEIYLLFTNKGAEEKNANKSRIKSTQD